MPNPAPWKRRLCGPGLPYRLVGATRFYQRREIKDVIAYLRLVDNTADSISFDRIINTPHAASAKRRCNPSTSGPMPGLAAGRRAAAPGDQSRHSARF
jgi:superfamily I DNA/RNA helicase